MKRLFSCLFFSVFVFNTLDVSGHSRKNWISGHLVIWTWTKRVLTRAPMTTWKAIHRRTLEVLSDDNVHKKRDRFEKLQYWKHKTSHAMLFADFGLRTERSHLINTEVIASVHVCLFYDQILQSCCIIYCSFSSSKEHLKASNVWKTEEDWTLICPCYKRKV